MWSRPRDLNRDLLNRGLLIRRLNCRSSLARVLGKKAMVRAESGLPSPAGPFLFSATTLNLANSQEPLDKRSRCSRAPARDVHTRRLRSEHTRRRRAATTPAVRVPAARVPRAARLHVAAQAHRCASTSLRKHHATGPPHDKPATLPARRSCKRTNPTVSASSSTRRHKRDDATGRRHR